MTSNESKAKANLIWDKLNSIENESKTRDEQINIIQSIIIKIAQEQRRAGRLQVLNYFDIEVKHLKDKNTL